MNIKCLIRHPGHGQTLSLLPKQGWLHFAASGTADGDVTPASGKLVASGGKTAIDLNVLASYRKGRFWVLSFTLTPDDLKTVAPPQEVQIFDGQGNRLAVSRNVRIKSGAFALIMINPVDGETLCPDFAAYGSSDSTATVTATLTLTDGTGSTTVTTNTDSTNPTSWTIPFSGLQPGLTGSLLVTQPGEGPAPASNLLIDGCVEEMP